MAEQPETSSSSSSRQPSSSNSVASTGNTQNSPQDATLPKQPQGPTFSGFPPYPAGDLPMFQVIHPLPVPGFSHLQNQEQMANRGAGIYAVPVPPYTAPFAGLPSNTLIPLTFNIPTGPSPDTATTGDHGQGGQQPQQQQQQHQHQAVGQRQIVVRRFQIAFQLDLLLILKLAAVVFLFNQDGSRQRLLVLVFFASLVYLYQTGALAPLVRWLSQSMQRAAAPPRPPRPAIRPENVPGAARQNENVPLAGEQVGVENENRPAQDANQAVENENAAEPGGAHNGGNQWWGIVKEIQMIVFGFITSLLPGFHNID